MESAIQQLTRSNIFGWCMLMLAIFFEVGGTIAMKLTEGLSRLLPSMVMLLLYVFSLLFLSLAMKVLELHVVYAVWSGLGTAIIALVGFFYFNEHLSLIKSISIILIIFGVVGLNFRT